MSKTSRPFAVDDSSLNLTMASRTPHPIAHAFVRMHGPGLGPAERWSTTLGFVDVTLRFLTALMYCELRGLGLSPAGHAAELLEKKLHDPKYGDWSRAAFELGHQLQGRDCLFPELAHAFGDNAGRTELALAFKEIIEERNEGAHQEIPFPGPVLAVEILERFQPKIQAICRGLRPFRQAPLWALLDNQQAEDGYLVSALRLVGESVAAVPPMSSQSIAQPPVAPTMNTARSDTSEE